MLGAAARQMSATWGSGPPLGIGAGKSAAGLLQPGVRIHRDVVFPFSRFGHTIDVAGVVPRHEDLIHRPVQLPPFSLPLLFGQVPGQNKFLRFGRSEDLRPGAGRLGAVGLPDSAEFRRERVLVLKERAINSFGTGSAKSASASALRSRESLSTPTSFSTCTIRTV